MPQSPSSTDPPQCAKNHPSVASVKWTADDSGAGSDWDGVIGTFGDAISLTSGAIAAGMFFDTKADSTITPSAKVYAGDVEVTGVDVDWSILDQSFSFTETWIEDTTAGTAAGSQTVTSSAGTWAQILDNKNITLAVDGSTGLGVTDGAGEAYDSTTSLTRDATKKGTWSTTGGALDLDDVMTYAALADSGESATVSATIHLNANIAGTDLDAQSYVNLSTAGMSLDVDDVYLAYGAGSDGVSVTENAAVGDAIKVKAGNATGTIVRVVAVDSVYGAELYDENTAGGRFVADATTLPTTLIVGTDAATVTNNAHGATVDDGVVTVTADAGTNGKTASLRLPVTVGSKNRFLTVALDIVK